MFRSMLKIQVNDHVIFYIADEMGLHSVSDFYAVTCVTMMSDGDFQNKKYDTTISNH